MCFFTIEVRQPPSHLGPTPLPTQLRAASFPCPRLPLPLPRLSLSAGSPDDPPPPVCARARRCYSSTYPSFRIQSNARSKDDQPPFLARETDRQREADRQRDFLGGKSQLFLCAGTELIFGGKDVRPELTWSIVRSYVILA